MRYFWTISKNFHRPYEWMFKWWWTSYITKTLTWNWYVDLTNAVANHLLHVKLFWKCVQNWTPTPDDPVAIVCNNWEIKASKNMANVNEQTIQLWYYISSSWVITADANNRIYKEYIPVQPNTTYTLSLSSSVYFVSISEYSTAEDSWFVVRKAWSTWSNTQLTITTNSDTNFVRFWTNIDRTEITIEEVLAINRQLETWSTATPYVPYSEIWYVVDWTKETVEDEIWNQAIAQNLFSVWDVSDVQEILHWHVSHNIWILILNWTENRQLATWTWFKQFYSTDTQTAIANSISLISTIAPYGCTASNRANYQFWSYSWWNWNLCFQMIWSSTINTVAEWTSRIASQYESWTPVIVVYEKKTPTAETVHWQTMNIVDWTNRIEIVDASIQNLPLEVQYKATS